MKKTRTAAADGKKNAARKMGFEMFGHGNL
jgi:hypothetical protein